jgi:tetratricopeptide (TPR) repeat protein
MRVVLLMLVLALTLTGCFSNSKGERLFDQGEYQGAVDFYSGVLEGNSNDLEARYNRARALQELSQYELAIKDYTFIIEKDERHLNARLSLAQIYYSLGEYAKSVVFSSAALKFHESSYHGHYLLARAKHHMGYTKAALKEYNAAIALKDDYGDAYLYRGALKSSMKITTACDDFQMAKMLNVSGAEDAVSNYCN